MRSRSKELLDRATSAMVAAIEIYNKPGFPYRSESFAILAINGWELLLKAKWLADNRNRPASLYVFEARANADGRRSKKRYVKRTEAGNPFTHSLSHLAKKLVENARLDSQAWGNIQMLLELRDSAVHFYNQSPAFRVRLQEIGAACAKNFATAVHEWFDRELSEFELHLMPLAFVDLPANMDGFLLNAEEKNFLNFLDTMERPESDPDSPYSVTVNIELKFTRSKARDALATRITSDPNAPAVRLTEERIREKYPWDYAKLNAKCAERYADFKVNRKYHDIRKPLQADPRFGAIRFLDPDNTSGQKKPFFNPNILSEFDKYYTRKARSADQAALLG
ncbi:DUF3644 domain-containing protein [Nitratidesulfovibrio liaohensis]|uniref:DUF3644 domain-containing protein n=1 Tax=Nitratidesulfovibrio liaohensis TaxID=2604158 RepID=A0ABY9R1Z2_9BACT|nr:DUF3644 domain-containing protein [Nitratidesulfovibrio liaohensis]WMW65739.1 DUF3644 domain-containing protein [Nitratidesulfovibrio liaohensis]